MVVCSIFLVNFRRLNSYSSKIFTFCIDIDQGSTALNRTYRKVRLKQKEQLELQKAPASNIHFRHQGNALDWTIGLRESHLQAIYPGSCRVLWLFKMVICPTFVRKLKI